MNKDKDFNEIIRESFEASYNYDKKLEDFNIKPVLRNDTKIYKQRILFYRFSTAFLFILIIVLSTCVIKTKNKLEFLKDNISLTYELSEEEKDIIKRECVTKNYLENYVIDFKQHTKLLLYVNKSKNDSTIINNVYYKILTSQEYSSFNVYINDEKIDISKSFGLLFTTDEFSNNTNEYIIRIKDEKCEVKFSIFV